MNKKPLSAVFEYYTFQLTPIKNIQLNIFELGISNVKELIEKKNEILLSVLKSDKFNFTYKGHRLQHKIIYAKGDVILMRVANVKSIRAERAFRKVYLPNEPSIILAFDNNPNNQTLAIQKDVDVFSNSDSVTAFIKSSLSRYLSDYWLEPEINNRFSTDDFWSIVEKYQNRITQLKIEITKENLSDIYRSVSDEIVEYGKFMNAQKQIIIQQAPTGGVLEHVDKTNETLKGFVEASSKGIGPISMKLAGYRRVITTKEKKISKEVDIIEIDNIQNENELLKIIDKIFGKDA